MMIKPDFVQSFRDNREVYIPRMNLLIKYRSDGKHLAILPDFIFEINSPTIKCLWELRRNIQGPFDEMEFYNRSKISNILKLEEKLVSYSIAEDLKIHPLQLNKIVELLKDFKFDNKVKI